MTVCIMAIACVWFALMLLVSSNTVRISRDEVTIVQNKALARGAMLEAMVLAEQAVQEGTLDALPTTLVQRSVAASDFKGELSATWRMLPDATLTITAQGQTTNGRYTMNGQFIQCRLPHSAGGDRPLLLAENSQRDSYLSAVGYDYVLKDDHSGGMVLDRTAPLVGNVYCYGNGQPDWTVTVQELLADGQELYVQGHLYVKGHLQVQRLLVTGDMYLDDDSTLACSEIWVGGEVIGNSVPELLNYMAEPPWQQTLVIKQMYNLSDE